MINILSMIRSILFSIQKKQYCSQITTTVVKKTEFDCENDKWTLPQGSEVNEENPFVKPDEDIEKPKRADKV